MIQRIPHLTGYKKGECKLKMGVGFPFMVAGLLKVEEGFLGSTQGFIPALHRIGVAGIVQLETIGIDTPSTDK